MQIEINSYGKSIAHKCIPFVVTVTIIKGSKTIVFTCMSNEVDNWIAFYR